jgi:RNA polymerase sigma-B factor
MRAIGTDRVGRGPARRRHDDAELRRYAAGRDPVLRDRLIRAYLPLAYSQARRFRNGPVPIEDLQQVAAIGLIKALDRFDPERGAAFSSFAVPTILGELRRHFRDKTWGVRVPRDLQERAVRLERERERLGPGLGRAPTAAELADRMGCTTEEIVEAMEAANSRAAISFDAPAVGSDDETRTLGERLGGVDAGFAQAESAATVASLLATLGEREQLVLRLRFHEDMTQSEIGAHVGCSQMHVSRILRAALGRLRLLEEGAPAAPAARATGLVTAVRNDSSELARSLAA